MKPQMPVKVPASLHLRLKPEEVRHIRKEAENSGETVSEWMRKKLLSDYTYDSLSDLSGPVSSNSLDLSSVRAKRGEEKRKFSSRSSRSVSLAGGNVDNEIGKRVGHRTGCPCWACNRFRELLGARLSN